MASQLLFLIRAQEFIIVGGFARGVLNTIVCFDRSRESAHTVVNGNDINKSGRVGCFLFTAFRERICGREYNSGTRLQ